VGLTFPKLFPVVFIAVRCSVPQNVQVATHAACCARRLCGLYCLPLSPRLPSTPYLYCCIALYRRCPAPGRYAAVSGATALLRDQDTTLSPSLQPRCARRRPRATTLTLRRTRLAYCCRCCCTCLSATACFQPQRIVNPDSILLPFPPSDLTQHSKADLATAPEDAAIAALPSNADALRLDDSPPAAAPPLSCGTWIRYSVSVA
jgi:hypothetical protein